MATGHWTQENRLLALATPLGEDKLLLRSFSGHEGISKLFQFRLDLLSEDAAIDFDGLIGQNVTFGVHLLDSSKLRYFNGYISRFGQLPREGRLARYEAEIVPWPWFLTRTTDCRIFQNKSVPQIVEEVFHDFGFHDFETWLTRPYQTCEYCVQYSETAFDFVSRLLEQEGIFYFFRHENGKHTLVLGDAPAVHRPCPEQATVGYEHVTGPGYNLGEDVVFSWRNAQEFRSGRYAVKDYNFESPAVSLASGIESQIRQGGNTRFEIYDYPGLFDSHSQGDSRARTRMEAEETPHEVITGDGNCRSFRSGHTFELTRHERRDQDRTYVLTSVTHLAEEGGFYSGIGSETEGRYSNSFTAIPHGACFRPPRVTPKALIRGSQTAVVVGPEGEEIYTDRYGRVKVHFHWDRTGQLNENSSCWIRVSQIWAGKGWGAMWLPRIGQEVVVDFLEGDPDRPLVTGRVYNGLELPPYDLPQNQTKSGITSRSSKGGGGFNEISFEDAKDHEEIYVHGQKDLGIRIENDRKEWVGHDHHLTVRYDRFEKVSGDTHQQVGGHFYQKLGGDHHLGVSGKEAIEIGQSRSVKVRGSYAESAGSYSMQSGGYYVTAGSIVLEAASITLKAGGNFITVGPGGVAINGSQVLINSGGAAGSGAAGTLVPPTGPQPPLLPGTGHPGGKDTGTDETTPPVIGGPPPGTHIPPVKKRRKTDEDTEKKSWIEIKLEDDSGKPVPGELYRVTLPDGLADEGTLDENGFARLEGLDPGICKIAFPNLDRDAWKPK